MHVEQEKLADSRLAAMAAMGLRRTLRGPAELNRISDTRANSLED